MAAGAKTGATDINPRDFRERQGGKAQAIFAFYSPTEIVVPTRKFVKNNLIYVACFMGKI
jgi:hypothetical protein